MSNIYSKGMICSYSSATESVEMRISKNLKTGEEKIWLTIRKSEVLTNTPENMKLLKSKYNQIKDRDNG